MSPSPPKNPSLHKAVQYLEYLAQYEENIFLESCTPEQILKGIAQRKQTAQKTGMPEKKVTARSLNPYPPYAPYDSLAQMEQSICGCLRCRLGSSRTKFVFGVGSESARVVFIGEAPGREEDLRGEPFVGRAGELLNQMLIDIGWQRRDVYICNILKCRPPNNRDPFPDEISMCEPYLHEQLRLLEAPWLVSLGRVAAQVLLRTTAPLKTLRGRVHKYRDRPFWVTYHPAALLRNMNLMPDAHQDLLTLKRMVESEASSPSGGDVPPTGSGENDEEPINGLED